MLNGFNLFWCTSVDLAPQKVNSSAQIWSGAYLGYALEVLHAGSNPPTIWSLSIRLTKPFPGTSRMLFSRMLLHKVGLPPQSLVACCHNPTGCFQSISWGVSPGNELILAPGKKKKKKKGGEKSEKEPEWAGEEEEEEPFPGLSHITSVAIAIALSVCTCSEQQLHRECRRQAISIVLLWEQGTSNGDVFSPKNCVGGDRERRRVCKYALAWSLLLQGWKLGHVCVQHPAATTWASAGASSRATLHISKKVWVGEVRIPQSHPPAYGGTTKRVSYPKDSSTHSPIARMGESVESQILSLVKHRLTHKLLITLIETRHRQESVGRVNHWKRHIYIAPLGVVLWQFCFRRIWSPRSCRPVDLEDVLSLRALLNHGLSKDRSWSKRPPQQGTRWLTSLDLKALQISVVLHSIACPQEQEGCSLSLACE